MAPKNQSSADGIKSILLGSQTEVADETESVVAPASVPAPGKVIVEAAVASPPLTAKEKKAQHIAGVRADLEAAISESAAAASLLAEVQVEAKSRAEYVQQLQFTLNELTKMSDAESAAEYFAAQQLEREQKAVLYRQALAAGQIDVKGTPRLAGYGPAPCDLAIAARNKAKQSGTGIRSRFEDLKNGRNS